MSNHDDVPAPLDGVAVAVADDYRRAAAARRGGGGGGGFQWDLRNRRFRTAFYYTVWGLAGITMSINVPSNSLNLDHSMLYFLFLVAGVNLLLLSMAAADDMPWMETAAACLEGVLARMNNLDF